MSVHCNAGIKKISIEFYLSYIETAFDTACLDVVHFISKAIWFVKIKTQGKGFAR